MLFPSGETERSWYVTPLAPPQVEVGRRTTLNWTLILPPSVTPIPQEMIAAGAAGVAAMGPAGGGRIASHRFTAVA